ncbi:MAG: ankyrin repeat domain-containing protein [bacterium]
MDPQFKPVMDAAYSGDFDLFKSLLKSDPSLITQTSSDRGDSPNLIQFIVVEGGLVKIPNAEKFLLFLIENGSTTERQLIAAASVNSRSLVDILLDAGVPLDEGAPWTALEETLYWRHRELSEYLHAVRGAKLETLCGAAMMGNIDKLTSFFKDRKPIPEVAPIYFPWGEIKGSTEQDAIDQAFLLALRNNQYEAASCLLECGAQINGIPPGNHEECTALHQAVSLNDIEMVDWLANRGALPTIKDRRFSADVFGWAEHQGKADILEHLNSRFAQ